MHAPDRLEGERLGYVTRKDLRSSS